MSTTAPVSPYRGLVPYGEEDAPIFFGRDAETEIITANLMASRLTLLYGASGVGKSSVLRAGAIHRLRQEAHQNLIERGAPELAVVAFSAWRDNPIAGLLNAVKEAVTRAWEGKPFEPVVPSADFGQTLEQWAGAVNGELMIILDQFEEYFLYHGQEDAPGSFAVELPRVLNRKNLRASFLIATREDSLAKLDRFKGRIPNLFDNYLRIQHLDRDAARDAIVKPLEYYNSLPENKTRPIKIETTLVDAILDQVKAGQVLLGDAGRGIQGAASSSFIETPYLQLVLTRLWDEERRNKSNTLRLDTLKRLGGAERIVRTHLDAAMNALSAGDQHVASHIFRYLVTPSGTKIAHTAPDLAAYAELPLKQIAPCLDKLASGNVRILRPVAPPIDQPQVARYEIYHDVLAAAIMDWRTRYEQNAQRARWTRIAGGLGAVALVIMCALLVWAVNASVLSVNATTAIAQSQATVQSQSQEIAQSQATVVLQSTAYAQSLATQTRQATVAIGNAIQADAQATAANVAQQQATAVLQLQEAIKTLAPESTPMLLSTPTLLFTPTPTRFGATGTPRATSTPDVRGTATAAARATADANARATAALVSTSVAQSLCLNTVDWVKTQLNANSRLRSTLGCTTGTLQPLDKVVQSFQNGQMIWRADNQKIYVLLRGSFKVAVLADTWKDGMSETSCVENPPSNLYQPVRGFGKVWCEMGGARSELGWAVGAETPMKTSLQNFENGFADISTTYATFILLNGTWTQLTPGSAK